MSNLFSFLANSNQPFSELEIRKNSSHVLIWDDFLLVSSQLCFLLKDKNKGHCLEKLEQPLELVKKSWTNYSLFWAQFVAYYKFTICVKLAPMDRLKEIQYNEAHRQLDAQQQLSQPLVIWRCHFGLVLIFKILHDWLSIKK